MAKKVVLENVELKPQVIGYSYKKKSNFGRVFIIFVVLMVVVYYINDVSIFINNLLGKKTAESINNLANKGNTTNNNQVKPEQPVEEVIYYEISDSLKIDIDGIIFDSFALENNKLIFNVNNNSSANINLITKKYFIETYNENKTLLQRIKVDVNTINSNSKVSFSLDIKDNFKYLVLKEKNVSDYPNIELTVNDAGIANLSCLKDGDTIAYSFKDNELVAIKHTIVDKKTTDENYNNRYTTNQSKVNNYNKIKGINASIDSLENGYEVDINIDLSVATINSISEKYYYSYKEVPKVVNFEMESYGFECK